MAAAKKKKAAETVEELEIEFEHQNDTAGTRRFRETGDKDNHKVGALYLKKAASASLGDPDSLTVTISAG